MAKNRHKQLIMKLLNVGLIVLLVIPILYGCGGLEPSVLSPGQIDSSMVDQAVKVRGKVLWVVENPGGLGGLYLQLGNGEGEVGLRIQDDIWKTLDDKEKTQFKEGKTITAEGTLFQAGSQLVVIFGKVPPP